MISKVIGIISYLPDNLDIRKRRFEKLKKLIKKCNDLFELPIIIIAQCWTEKEIWDVKNTYENCLIQDNLNKLGISGARETLRTYFIKSQFDYLITLDDDSVLIGDKESALKYLEEIDRHPSGFGEFKKTLFKLFAISKDISEKEPFNLSIKPEDGDGFEDRIYVNTLRIKYPEKRYIFKKYNLDEYSIVTKDMDSTWYTNQDIQKMLLNTENIIKKTC